MSQTNFGESQAAQGGQRRLPDTSSHLAINMTKFETVAAGIHEQLILADYSFSGKRQEQEATPRDIAIIAIEHTKAFFEVLIERNK